MTIRLQHASVHAARSPIRYRRACDARSIRQPHMCSRTPTQLRRCSTSSLRQHLFAHHEPTNSVLEGAHCGARRCRAGLAVASGHARSHRFPSADESRRTSSWRRSSSIGGSISAVQALFAKFRLACEIRRCQKPDTFTALITDKTKALYCERRFQSRRRILRHRGRSAKIAHDAGVR